MIRITSLKIKAEHNKDDILNAVSKKLRLDQSDIKELYIVKKSLDARDKENIRWNYIVDISTSCDEKILGKFKNDRNISTAKICRYKLPKRGLAPLKARPCIVGSGPAGLFCAYFLAKEGYRPVLIEQGEPVEDRIKTVNEFWESKKLDPRSNIQFGEGGAGTFSDGKLNTGVNDKAGRNRLVLETFVENGAPSEILYSNKPHIGTDVLSLVVSNMRKKIIGWRGEVLFNTKFTDLAIRNGKLVSVAMERGSEILIRPCNTLVLAIGHSSRDTFYMLKNAGLEFRAKSFAVGLRAENLQENINKVMYGKDYTVRYNNSLPPADYKLTYKAKDGRGVYTFCMCPGGYVINASSEENALCVNGMSYLARDGKNANSAIVVTVNPEDTGALTDPLKGIEFQRDIERKAYQAGGGSIPVQRLKDFKGGLVSDEKEKDIMPQMKGSYCFSDLNSIFPEFICRDIKEAFESFGKKIEGFDDPDVLLSAAESRTSSPVRICRDERFESNIKGIFPAGEGAGYSGGITSSAIDGIKIFEEIYRRYAPR